MENATSNHSEPDWAPKGECPKDYFKVKPAAAKTTVDQPVAHTPRNPRPIAAVVQPRNKATTPAIPLAPIPPADLGSDVVVVTCMVWSDLDKRQTGLWRAVTEPNTRPICFTFKIGTALLIWSNEPIPQAQFPGAQFFTGPCPGPVAAAANAGATFVCNTLVIDQVMYQQQGWPEPKSWKSILAPLAAANCKRNIDHAASVLLGVPANREDRQFISGLWNRKGTPLSGDERARAVALAVRRAQIIAALASKIGISLGRDEETYQLDSKINADGALVDLELVRGAIEMNTKLKATLDTAAKEALLQMPSKPTTFKAALNALKISLPDMKVHTLRQALKCTTDFNGRLFLVTLLLSKQTSSSKFEKVIRMVCADGFLRGLYLYCQARTGRWSSEDTQVQNLKRTKLNAEEIARLIQAIKSRDVDAMLDAVPLEKLHEAICGLIRTAFIPRPGNCFLIADFKQIEVRVMFWLADSVMNLHFLKTRDLYVEFAVAIFGETPPDHPEFEFRRSVGKVGILGCQFGMGAAALLDYCLTYGIDLAARGIDPKAIVDAYRSRFKKVKALWTTYQNASLAAIKTSQPVAAGHCTFKMLNGDLHVILPSGRALIYHNARIEAGTYGDVLGYTHYKSKHHSVEVQAWGGKIAENICQAVARDALADAMVRVSKAGFRPTLHTHDEVACEVLSEQVENAEPQFKALLETSPMWAPYLPLAVEIFKSDRYGEESILA